MYKKLCFLHRTSPIPAKYAIAKTAKVCYKRNMPEIPVKEALNKAYIKARPEREAIERFKANFITLLDGIQASPAETEEHLKNLVSDFLKKTWYDPDYNINTSARIDLVIHTGKTAATPIGVIIEAKRPGNKTEMISRTSLNAKAMQELLLYYLRETIDNKNLELKHLIITNTQEWYIFDARDFYHCFSQNKDLVKLYSDFKTGALLEKDVAGRKVAVPPAGGVQNRQAVHGFAPYFRQRQGVQASVQFPERPAVRQRHGHAVFPDIDIYNGNGRLVPEAGRLAAGLEKILAKAGVRGQLVPKRLQGHQPAQPDLFRQAPMRTPAGREPRLESHPLRLPEADRRADARLGG
jgi:hypothetical protein